MIAIDAKVRFYAFCYEDNGLKHTPVMVNGTVYAVNYAHKTFHCEYEFEGVKMRQSFKFNDIGKVVKIVGRKKNAIL